jgi:hypothetical protein
MKVFQFLLSGEDKTIALVVGAPSEERATELIAEDYDLVEDRYEEDGVEVYRSGEIPGVTSDSEFVQEIFSTEEL